ncbi:MAG: AmmeMemoRadiSam system protein A [Planctomycetota bacterium]|jgi:AmmeMemoRadiSam system protein A
MSSNKKAVSLDELERKADLESGSQPAPKGRPGLVRRLYLWTIHWAGTPHAAKALAAVSFAESSFFPVPPDVLLIPMALARPQKALRYAVLCTVASVLGGCLGYGIGVFAFEQVGRPILSVYNAWPQFDRVAALYRQYGSVAVFGAALTPIPYKVFTIASGVFRMSFPAMIAASVLGRGLRFFAVCWLIRRYPGQITRFIDKYFNLLTILFVILLALGFVGVRLLVAGNEQGEGSGPESSPAEASATHPGVTRSALMLSENSRKQLLNIARRTVEAVVKKEQRPQFDIQEPELCGQQGAFVTLRTNGNLRGCIGRFIADRPLWQIVRDMAVAAASEDPRFFGMQIQPAELPDVRIEISVLSPLRRIRDPMQEVELGKHGIYMKHGVRSGCFLPQVATETGWSKEEFLSHCCSGKAGLPPDAWEDPRTEVYVFTAEVLEEAPAP